MYLKNKPGAAAAARAEQEANQIVALAKANATRVRVEGEAEASKESNIGLAKAQAIDAQVKAYGGAEYRVINEIADKLADAISNAKVDVVPKTIVNFGEAQGNDNSIVSSLMKLLTLEKLGVKVQNIEETTPKE